MAVAPWTREDIQQMIEDQELEQDEELGDDWRSFFEDDIDSLWMEEERATNEWCETLMVAMDMTKNDYDDSGMEELIHKFPAPMATSMIGMGTWRLKAFADPAIQFMVSRIEGCWREMLYHDLNLYPWQEWKGKGHDFCDNMDPKRELKGFAYADVPNPEKGEEGYPRLLLENRVYCSRVFRKLHIEVVWRQDGLQVMHVVLYPRYDYDMPILAMDLVIAGGAVTLAIIDACPVRSMKLPPHYMQTMKELQDQTLTDPDNQRAIPEWGQNIFSPLCVCMRPKDGEEFAGFMKYAVGLHRAHMMLAQLSEPVSGGDKTSVRKQAELLAGHKSFVDNQLANKKTTRVLEAAFGQEWTDDYMNSMMFDFKPEDEPEVYSSEVEQLYEYFDQKPELGSLVDEIEGLQEEQDAGRATEYLTQAMTGYGGDSPLNQSRVEWSLLQSYDSDPNFRNTLNSLIPDCEEMRADGSLGTFLAEHLAELSGGNWDQSQNSSWTK
eukprot:gene16547-22776_t